MRTPAFTLIELLVAISIIALLIGILLPVLGAARVVGQRATTLSDIRQTTLAYSVYQLDYDGHVIWGFPPGIINGEPVLARDPQTGTVYGVPVSERYPWRLGPYIQNVWDVIYSGQEPPPRDNAYFISLIPTFGLNTVFVGGHVGPWRGFVPDSSGVSGSFAPNAGEHVVFWDREVQDTSELIVFAEVFASTGGASPFESLGYPEAGMFWATPPWAGWGTTPQRRWVVSDGKAKSAGAGPIQGLPGSRSGEGVPTSFFDGHAEVLSPEELDDMQLWANDALAADDDVLVRYRTTN
ncbi:MAG: prepilin-type N-terminal cleavage/methylation domain-containing protein [Planctomycetota bacterium]